MKVCKCGSLHFIRFEIRYSVCDTCGQKQGLQPYFKRRNSISFYANWTKRTHTHTLHTNGGRMFRPLQLFSHSKYIFDMEEQSNRWDYCAKHKLVRNNAHLRERGFKSIWKRARANIRHTKWTTVFWILWRISQNCKYIFYSVYTSSAESKSRFSWSTSWMSVFVLLFFLS